MKTLDNHLSHKKSETHDSRLDEINSIINGKIYKNASSEGKIDKILFPNAGIPKGGPEFFDSISIGVEGKTLTYGTVIAEKDNYTHKNENISDKGEYQLVPLDIFLRKYHRRVSQIRDRNDMLEIFREISSSLKVFI